MSNETRLSPAALLALAALSGEAAAVEKDQLVYSAGSQPSFSGPQTLFTGQVDVQVVFPGDQKPFSGAYVTFQPSARTAWHSHPAGQHMVVTKGTAITATRAGQVVEFHEGEAVWCPEDIDHWHGATPHSAMTHFVITGSNEKGENVTWKDKVTDAQYQAALDSLADQQPELKALDSRYQQLAVVAAYAAGNQSGSLKIALNNALDAGLTVNELKEVMIHLYPYGGFPKALNALATMMAVVEERKAEGKKDVIGDAATELPENALAAGTKIQTKLVGHPVEGPLFDFAPAANTFLRKHLFGDVFGRGLLDNQAREVLTVAMLASMDGTDSQLRSHIFMAMNTGLSQQQLQDIGSLLDYRVGKSVGQRVVAAIADVVKK
ncbi:(R)-mandelonitrile lyase [Oceanobacter mangrovi]|uniref:(R)-mandelonitrile lyase n=1 Tax=Oceanobacter mangrovi TaxID=2862510 RepID=UPI001C8DAE17|nr:carboxymuconolactone decarboxylase family protein [Oceanobacter mangrovi]